MQSLLLGAPRPTGNIFRRYARVSPSIPEWIRRLLSIHFLSMRTQSLESPGLHRSLAYVRKGAQSTIFLSDFSWSYNWTGNNDRYIGDIRDACIKSLKNSIQCARARTRWARVYKRAGSTGNRNSVAKFRGNRCINWFDSGYSQKCAEIAARISRGGNGRLAGDPFCLSPRWWLVIITFSDLREMEKNKSDVSDALGLSAHAEADRAFG